MPLPHSVPLEVRPINPVPAAMEILKSAMADDPEYGWSWHCVIAMAGVDEGMDRATANQMAARVMCMAFDFSAPEHFPDRLPHVFTRPIAPVEESEDE